MIAVADGARRWTPPRIAFALLIAALAAAIWWLAHTTRLAAVEHLGIPTMHPEFADARTVTGASVSLAQGLDPAVANPGDPWSRPFNYPRVWLGLARLGIDPDDTTAYAAAMLAALLLGLAALLPLANDLPTLMLLAPAVCAPTTWFAIERGNNDLMMFGLISCAAFAARRRPRTANALVLSAAVLKLFPAFALANLLGGSRRTALRVGGIAAAGLAGYALWIRHDLVQIAAATEHKAAIEYGIATVPLALAARTGTPVATWMASAGALVVASAVGALWLRHRVRLVTAPSPHAFAAFLCGAAIYVGTFCLGRNFDYRLIFLILTVPQLGHWCRATNGWSRRFLAGLIAVLLVALWSLTLRHAAPGLLAGDRGMLLDEALTWTLCLGLLVTLGLALPDWALPQAWHNRPALDGSSRAPIACWEDAILAVRREDRRRRDAR